MISLCIIAGNVEDYIERMLKSFAPIADEICVVRAIGNLKPDRTLEIAEKEFGARVSEYRNAREHEDWPHVDSFAAARNLSFEMSKGDFCIWADTDDVLVEGAELIRKHAALGGYDAYIFPYQIFGWGLRVPRERLIRRGSGRWIYPVHECFDFTIEPANVAQDDRVVIQHFPHDKKEGSNSRNLLILNSIPEAELTTGLLYHFHVELALSQNETASIAMAEKILARPDLGKAERHEVFINLARFAQKKENWDLERTLLHHAFAADPERREALALLCNNAMNTHRAKDALAFARQMMATQRPANVEWNDRGPIYGWVGDDLYAQSLRMNGLRAEAEAIRKRGFAAAGGPRIALVHATRGRLVKAAAARKLWLDRAEKPWTIEHIFCIDEDDLESAALKRFHHVTVAAGGGCVRAFNQGAWATTAPVIVIMADDVIPPQKWDAIILERLGDVTAPKVLAVSDGIRNDPLLTAQILTRGYLQIDGFVYHPLFKAVFADNWFTHCAYGRDAVIEARDVTFEHDHPIKTGAPLDATYIAQNSPDAYEYGRRVMEHLIAEGAWRKEAGSVEPGTGSAWAHEAGSREQGSGGLPAPCSLLPASSPP